MTKYTKRTIRKLIEILDLPPISQDWHEVAPFMIILERIKSEGSVFILKLDGERNSAAGEPPYTILISGAPLGDDFIRIDAMTLEEGLILAIGSYAEKVWRLP